MNERWYSDAELERIKELRAANVTIPLIAAELGWTKATLRQVLNQEGLSKKYKPRGLVTPTRFTLSCCINEELYQQFTTYCKQENISYSQKLTELIQQFIQSSKAKDRVVM